MRLNYRKEVDHSRLIGKDTTLCISLAARPSNIGTRFHNYLYNELDLDYLYKAFTTTDLAAAIGGVKALGIRGCSVSMPFKEECIQYLDVMHPSASAIASVNTIVNENGELHAYNTDYQAVVNLLQENAVDTGLSYAVAGSGGMAKAVVAALHDSGFANGTVIARNAAAGRALAEQYGASWAQSLTTPAQLLVNATPIGMEGGPESTSRPFTENAIDAAEVVFDVVAKPSNTPLVLAALQRSKVVITGAEVIALQAAEQFDLYTGVRPTPDQISRASAYSRLV